MDIELEKADLRQAAYKNHTMKVVHDLKNPVLAIQQILKDSSDVETIRREVQDETAESLEMLDGLRLAFKVENHMDIKEEPQLVCLLDFVNSLKSSHVYMADTCKNKLFCEVNSESESFTHYMFPRTIVKRILNNFITNSLKHTYKGKIHIKANYENLQYNKIVYRNIKMNNNKLIKVGTEINPKYNYVKFEVTDTGYGIPDSKINSIFDEMNSDQAGKNWDGCGLGLAICKSLALQINASIMYTSQVNVGSSFILYVPVINEQNELASPELNETKEIFKKNSVSISKLNTIDCDIYKENNKKSIDNNEYKEFENHDFNLLKYNPVIIAEDSRILCRTYSRYLERENIEFQMYMNGQECLENIVKIVAQNNEQNINQRIMVITDNNMPLKNGIELAKELRAMNAQFYIVLISADIPKNYHELFDEVFLKPIQVSKLKDCIIKNYKYINDEQ